MKKILSLILAISLCLSAVILLASCKGKSAYEVAVEGGFTGTEQEWLASLKGETGEKGKDGEAGKAGAEGYPGLPGDAGLSPYEDLTFNQGYLKTVQEWLASLKGADAKDGHTSVVTVDDKGFWVIDGTRQPIKVDGSKAAVVSVELVNNVFSVVKGDTAAPKLEIKVALDDGSESILPVSNTVIADTSYDLTKEGVYPVTIKYGDKEVASEIVVEGLMVYYENFNSLANDATMADICAEAGFQIPVPALDHPYTVKKITDGVLNGTQSEEKYKYSDLYAEGIETWFLDGSDLTPYVLYGGLHRGNYVQLKVDNGRLYYTSHTNNGKIAGSTDSFLIIANDEEMNYAATDTYTLQMDFLFQAASDNGTPDDTTDDIKGTVSSGFGGTLAFLVKFMDEGAKTTSAGRPISVCAAFGLNYLMANVIRKSSWNIGKNALDAAGFETANDQSMDLLATLFPEKTDSEYWWGEEITVRIVVRARTSDNPGYTVYVKKAADAEDKFQLVGEFDAEKTTTSGFNAFMNEVSDGFGLQTRSLQTRWFWVDNIAAWTGDGNMPTNTSTATYEALNEAYNASLTPAA